ncbi:MAG: molecular chaperone GrpE [Corynebacterium sp.]|nr:molecular chaperone GrpE [Corynebacterium sp.]
MMTQDLFEHPAKQYKQFNIASYPQLSQTIGHPDDFVDGVPNDEQAAAMEDILNSAGDATLTFDEASGLWITGSESAIEDMFAQRDEFLDALEANEHTEPA